MEGGAADEGVKAASGKWGDIRVGGDGGVDRGATSGESEGDDRRSGDEDAGDDGGVG